MYGKAMVGLVIMLISACSMVATAEDISLKAGGISMKFPVEGVVSKQIIGPEVQLLTTGGASAHVSIECRGEGVFASLPAPEQVKDVLTRMLPTGTKATYEYGDNCAVIAKSDGKFTAIVPIDPWHFALAKSDNRDLIQAVIMAKFSGQMLTNSGDVDENP